MSSLSRIAAPPSGRRAISTQLFELLLRLTTYMGCSTPLTDRCVTACLEAGAYGAKLTGSGHGDCMFAVVPNDRVPTVVAALDTLPVRHLVWDDAEPPGVEYTLLTDKLRTKPSCETSPA